VRDGIAPSYLWLPEGQWSNMISFLTSHFPDVGEATWLSAWKEMKWSMRMVTHYKRTV
jgi:hypothetical protein